MFDYAQAMLDAGRVLPPPEPQRDHVYERYLPPPDDAFVPLAESVPDPDAIAPLDPVCMMDVDPATAKWSADHANRIDYFCAPAYRRLFLTDPEAYAAL